MGGASLRFRVPPTERTHVRNPKPFPELEAAAQKFLALLQAQAPRPPKKRSKNDPWPETLSNYRLRRTMSPHWPFMLNLGPGYKYLCVNGDMYDFAEGSKVRTGYFGNVFTLATKEVIAQYLEWKKTSGDVFCGWYARVDSQECNVCRRTKGVRETVLGYRCQYCRASDSRLMGTLRRLGHVPTNRGIPITDYLVNK